MNERYYEGSSAEDEEEDYPEQDYKVWEKSRPLANRVLMFAALGVSLLALVIFVIWFTFPVEKSSDSKQLKMLETRVRTLENKLLRFDQVNEQLIRLENQTKKFAHAVDRFDQFETNTTLRMDVLAKALDTLQNEPVEIKPVASDVAKIESPKKETLTERYHIVRSGETLYSISRHYSLTVDKLREFNKLKIDTTIYPGQKLIISPSDHHQQ